MITEQYLVRSTESEGRRYAVSFRPLSGGPRSPKYLPRHTLSDTLSKGTQDKDKIKTHLLAVTRRRHDIFLSDQ